MASRRPTEQTRAAQKQVGRNIRARRHLTGESQERFALRAGVDRGFMGRIERGETNPTVGMLVVLAQALDCTVADLVDGV